MTDIVERLRAHPLHNRILRDAAEEIERLREEDTVELTRALLEIERLRAEVELWKDRCESERRDHEATINHANKTMRGEP